MVVCLEILAPDVLILYGLFTLYTVFLKTCVYKGLQIEFKRVNTNRLILLILFLISA
jgi:hypothetical protein